MGQRIIKIQISVLSLALMVIFWHLPAYADLVSINQELTIQHTGSSLTIPRNLDLQGRQTDEIARGSDLMRAIKDFVRRTRDSLRDLKSRQSDQIRGIELNRVTNDNTKDTIRRNKITQQAQKRFQRDRMQALKARNRDLNQRIRDLSRK